MNSSPVSGYVFHESVSDWFDRWAPILTVTDDSDFVRVKLAEMTEQRAGVVTASASIDKTCEIAMQSQVFRLRPREFHGDCRRRIYRMTRKQFHVQMTRAKVRLLLSRHWTIVSYSHQQLAFIHHSCHQCDVAELSVIWVSHPSSFWCDCHSSVTRRFAFIMQNDESRFDSHTVPTSVSLLLQKLYHCTYRKYSMRYLLQISL